MIFQAYFSFLKKISFTALMTVLSLSMGIAVAQAQPLVVTNPNDDGSVGTLRYMVQEANGLSGPNTINFDVEDPIVLDGSLGPIYITDDLEIIGPDLGPAKKIAIQVTGQASRIFISTSDSNVLIQNLSFTSPVIAGQGEGCLYLVGGSLTIRDSEFTECQCLNANGGALSVINAPLSIERSQFVANSSERDDGLASRGGAIFFNSTTAAELSISQSFFSVNEASANLNNSNVSLGGAVYFSSDGSLEINESIFINNATRNEGEAGSSSRGGSLYTNGPTSVDQSAFIQNLANQRNGYPAYGGAIHADIDPDETLSVTNTSFVGNTANNSLAGTSAWGGAIRAAGGLSVTLSNLSLINNQADYGGALYITDSLEVNLQHLSLEGNEAAFHGTDLVSNVPFSLQNSLLAGRGSGDNAWEACYLNGGLTLNDNFNLGGNAIADAWLLGSLGCVPDENNEVLNDFILENELEPLTYETITIGYIPSAESRLIDRGIPIEGLLTDALGNPRVLGLEALTSDHKPDTGWAERLRCGDGHLVNTAILDQSVEECDDGNLTDGDGCDSQCKIEPENTNNTIANIDGDDLPPANIADPSGDSNSQSSGGCSLQSQSSTPSLALSFFFLLSLGLAFVVRKIRQA
ncbi:MAG: hypothetical protein KDK66_08530 [Deltaproteobacteria bacterium]|nr:hypothetical protein [Deltaproteobacteria bacterium]